MRPPDGVTFPGSPTAHCRNRRERAMTPEKGAAPRRVLVVEDNRDSRETLRVLLELWGYNVEEAEDGLEGVRKALAWRPEAAVVDIGMPALDGYGVAREVRANLGHHIYLLALT